ncbi:MAG: hypothetical protein K9I34_03740 [Bacteroidales bacterium]|nr:hypothetical protein [Bacteroidales bacterium]
MSSLLDKIMSGISRKAPKAIQESFKQNFKSAKNIEWHQDKNGCYEAVFYKDKLEHIAKFDCGAILLEYKINLTEEHLPLLVKKLVENKGEIMNYVLINRGNRIMYEVIFRLSPNERYSMLLTELGEILEEKEL